MSDPASTARAARESLSRGLNALQSDPKLPPKLVDLAAPIAQAMGALHQIERSNGQQLLPHANIALENVRAALSALQTEGQGFPAVATAMESVASSLGQVHALSKLAGSGQPQAAPVPQQIPAQQAEPPRTQPVAQQAFVPQPVVQQQAAFPAPAAQPVYAAPQQQQAYAPPPQQQQPQAYAPPPQPQFAADPFAAMPQQNTTTPAGNPADMPVHSADLGAQSMTNFYKGLSGNDIIDHGGLFISTYKIPKIGTPVRLRISLPGGYEFEANAIVRWSREASDQGDAAPPGFGAQFTQITNEARQLIYRYVRNREPLFHDDL